MRKAAKQSKPKKHPAVEYEEKLAINGSFGDVFRVIKKNSEEKSTTLKL